MAVTGTARIFGLLSSLVRTIASIIGGLIIVHAVFVLFGANERNILVEFTAGIRDSFGWFTHHLFLPKDEKTGQAINDALAGFIWVFLGSMVAKFIARLAPAGKAKDKGSKDDTPRSTPVQRSKPAEKPQQDAPAEPAPAAQAEAPRAQTPKEQTPKEQTLQEQALQVREEPAPEPVVQHHEESHRPAKHQARATARNDERVDERAEDRAQA